MRKLLPYPFQYLRFLLFILFFTRAIFFASEGQTIIFILQGWSHGGLNWDLPVLFDSMRLLFAATVSLISSAIFTFGHSYMRGEPIVLGRFWSLVILFVISMFVVIFVPNLLIMMLGWDGLGMTRFILVIHYQRRARLYGGYITVLSNRVGDALLFIVIGILARWGHRVSLHLFSEPVIDTLRSQIISADYVVLSLLSLAAYSKSAQLPFNAWLPEAIAAPTPVRALVHSSTLVTAGVYLLIRTYEFWSPWPIASLSIFITGVVTILMGGGKATIEGDVKKTIAYSTMRQLGYMVTILGLGHPRIAFFHLITHALFKSTLFIRAGVVFSYGHHYQTYDQWHSKWHVPLAGAGIAISLLAMNAFPFLAGIYSKELIVTTAASQIFHGTQVRIFYGRILTLVVAASQTIIYTVRIWRGLFFTKYTARAYYFIEKPAYRPDIYTMDNIESLRLPFLTLILGSITGGRVVMWVILTPADLAFFPGFLKVVIITAIIRGVMSAFLPCRGVTKSRVNQRVFRVRSKRWSLAAAGGIRKHHGGGMCLSKRSHFMRSGTEGDFSHAHDGAHFFIDRTFTPVYRMQYLSIKFTSLVENGILQLWSLRAPATTSREASLLSQNVVKHVNSYLGISLIGFTALILLLLFYPSLRKALHLYCNVGCPGSQSNSVIWTHKLMSVITD